MSNEADKTLEPNIFDLLSDAKWAFSDAAVAVRSVADNLASKNATTEDAFLQVEVLLEKAAVIADKIAVFTTSFPDAYMQPEYVSTIARDAKRVIRTERDWQKLAAKSREIGRDDWRLALVEWAEKEGMGEEWDLVWIKQRHKITQTQEVLNVDS